MDLCVIDLQEAHGKIERECASACIPCWISFGRNSKERHEHNHRQIRLLIGTDAASEGLNLQSPGALINLDLPWNPTRLEQRKGRIQRIGQMYDDIWIFNLRYGGSAEDRVHDLLSDRLQSINTMFGQIPDVLEDVWVEVAQNKIDDAKQTINALPPRHPFELKYERPLGKIPWEECSTVLDKVEMQETL